jgi:hypothetical protein
MSRWAGRDKDKGVRRDVAVDAVWLWDAKAQA